MSGKLQVHVFSALAEFERGLIRERTQAVCDSAKRALFGGLLNTKKQVTKEAEERQVEMDHLKAELEAYK